MRKRRTKKDRVGATSLNQRSLFFGYLLRNIATSSMVSNATGIPQKNCTRYKKYYQDRRMLWEVRREICQVTGFLANYLSTNPIHKNK